MTGPGSSYAVVTPARDEAANLERLAAALAVQRLPPAAWVVVDDGSSDGTAELLRRLAGEHAWVRPVQPLRVTAGQLERGRREGGALEAFRRGLDAIPRPVDVVVKVDADVDFDPDYFEQLVGRFASDDRLAIASGTCHELEDGAWVRRTKADTTVWGASRAYRWDCLDDVRALEPRMGWDGLDEIRVQLRGLHTATFVDLPFRHHRAEGGRERSPWHHGAAMGRASWYMGYRPSYLALRASYRAVRQPAALGMLWGYAAAAAGGEPRCADAEVVREIRDRQRLRATLRRGAPAS